MALDKQLRDKLIDDLLTFINDEIDQMGRPAKLVRFDFEDSGEDAVAFIKNHPVSYADLSSALNVCLSRKYLKPTVMTGKKYLHLILTEEGQGRAISIEQAKHAPPTQKESGDIHIGELHSHGATQIGNHNTQNIENLFSEVIERIEQSAAPEEEKREAKSRLKEFLEHPLTGTAIGLAPTAIKALCGGA